MDLSTQFSALKQVRVNIKKTIDGLSIEQLNKVPEGFNNNLIWHYAHVIVTQQLLCYKLSSLPMLVDEDLINRYKIGTKPEAIVSQKEYEQFQELDAKLVTQVEKDYNNNLFTVFKTYTTSFGMTLESAEDAISFNNVHEGIHLGNMISMKRLV